MIQNRKMGNGCLTKQPFDIGCLELEVGTIPGFAVVVLVNPTRTSVNAPQRDIESQVR